MKWELKHSPLKRRDANAIAAIQLIVLLTKVYNLPKNLNSDFGEVHGVLEVLFE